MGCLEDLKMLGDARPAKLSESDIEKYAGNFARAARATEGVESVAKRGGLASGHGELSKFRVAEASLRAAKTSRQVHQVVQDEYGRFRQSIVGSR